MAADRNEPASALVSIAIPTFNRAASLERALRSAVAQTHRPTEVVVSDNASTDATAQVCAAFAQDDERVRVIRRPTNAGPIANFNAVVEACQGRFVLLLADDDWLAPDYVERCLTQLRARPNLALACGRARYYRDDVLVEHGVPVRLNDPDPARRVAGFFSAVYDNATFYGLMRADVARVVFPMANELGGDWLLIARVALLGGIETVDDTTLSRSLGGVSASLAGIAEHTGQSPGQARHAHLMIGWSVLREIGWHSPLYARLGRANRLVLAVRCQPSLVRHWLIGCEARLFLQPVMQRARAMRVRRRLRARVDAARRRSPG